MEFLFSASKAAANLLLPPSGLLLLMVLSLLTLRRWPRASWLTLWLSSLTLAVLSLPWTARALASALQPPPLDRTTVKAAQAIVVLSGGVQLATPEWGDTLATRSLARTRYAARLAKEFSLPVLVTGGTVYGGPAEADVMARVLREEFGVTPRWIEKRSRHTAENLRFSMPLLARDNVRAVLLVTDDLHMRRALAHCAGLRLRCLPAPVTVVGSGGGNWVESMPNAGALQNSSYALHEILGYWLRDWR